MWLLKLLKPRVDDYGWLKITDCKLQVEDADLKNCMIKEAEGGSPGLSRGSTAHSENSKLKSMLDGYTV